MRTHGALTEVSVSYHPDTPDRKGREGKGREVSHPSIVSTGSANGEQGRTSLTQPFPGNGRDE